MSLNHQRDYNERVRAWLLDVFAHADALSRTALHQRKCPVCGSSDSRFFANNNYLDYVQCDCCALVYMNPAPLSDEINSGFKGQDKLLSDYFSIMQQFKGGIPSRPDPELDNNLRDIYAQKKSGRLIDIGCSVGDFLHKAKYWYDVEGIEINPETAAIAEKHFKVHKKFLAELNFDSSYDIVTLNQLLYGVPEPVELLTDINGILKDDGIVYINSPNADSLAVKTYSGQVNHLYGYTTSNVFNRKSLETLCEKTGFKILSFRTEWIDVYLTDLMEFHAHPELFIHKRNSHLEDYEKRIQMEDKLQAELNLDLGNEGNYFVAVLGKANTEDTIGD